MSKIDLSVKVQMTPSQAVALLHAMRNNPWEFGQSKWRSIHDGAESRVRNALMDAGWSFDGKYWVKK